MHILQVSSHDIAGGAERIAWELFRSLSQRGYTSSLAVGQKTVDDPAILEIPNDVSRDRWARMWRTLRSNLIPDQAAGSLLFNALASIAEPKRSWHYLSGVEDFNFPGTRRLLDLPPRRPDIVHAHNLHGGYFDLRALPYLSQHVPVILTLHDAWLLSGHCAHSFACDRWRTGCGHCPDLVTYPAVRRDATAYNWQRKQHIFAQSRVYAAVPCQWLADKVRRSMVQEAIVETRIIHHGIDLSVFQPGDKSAARSELDLPQNALIALFVANQARRNTFKDYQTMVAAIRQTAPQTDDQEVVFVCLGDTGPDERIGSALIRYVGHLDDSKKVARYYRAADVYLHAARAEVWGLSITEALACGVPVIATAVGGIPEQIEEGRTGFLVPAGDSVAMARRIQQLCQDRELRTTMGIQAARSAAYRFDQKRMVDDYVHWYEEIIEKEGNSCSGDVATEVS